jgi:hypothetical protein
VGSVGGSLGKGQIDFRLAIFHPVARSFALFYDKFFAPTGKFVKAQFSTSIEFHSAAIFLAKIGLGLPFYPLKYALKRDGIWAWGSFAHKDEFFAFEEILS